MPRRYTIRKEFAERRAAVIRLLSNDVPRWVIARKLKISRGMVTHAIRSVMNEYNIRTEARLGAWWVMHGEALDPQVKCVKCGIREPLKGRRDCRECASQVQKRSRLGPWFFNDARNKISARNKTIRA